MTIQATITPMYMFFALTMLLAFLGVLSVRATGGQRISLDKETLS